MTVQLCFAHAARRQKIAAEIGGTGIRRLIPAIFLEGQWFSVAAQRAKRL